MQRHEARRPDGIPAVELEGFRLRKRIAGPAGRSERPGPAQSSAGKNGRLKKGEHAGARRTPTRSNRKQLGGNGANQIEAPKLPAPSTLKAAELLYFKGLLLAKRREILGDVDNMEREALRKNRLDASGDLSMMPIHMADIGTDNYEQEFTIGLIAGERETLKEIDEALGRIASGTYGMCLGTQQPIPRARLRAKPWARYCIEYKMAQEARLRGRNGRY